MKPPQGEIRLKLKEAGLKITPQRLAILEAVHELGNHPTAESVIEHIRGNHPNIASGTVYKVLDVLVENKLIRRVKTEKDIMRYDGIMEEHHHLYCAESERIEDYSDNHLDELLRHYFEKKGIPGFRIEEIRLQIKGRFNRGKK
jgi:Fur family transcriptional regulator, peroxide stress response regulator